MTTLESQHDATNKNRNVADHTNSANRLAATMRPINRIQRGMLIALLLAILPVACEKESANTSTGPAADDATTKSVSAEPTDSAVQKGERQTSDGESVENAIAPILDTSKLPADTKIRIERLQQAHLAAPKSSNRIENLGLGYASINEIEAAAGCFEAAAELMPRNFKFHYIAGLLRLRLKDAQTAQRAFERAAKLDPNYVAVHIRLGQLTLEGDPTVAKSHFEKALSIDANDEIAWWGLGQCAESRGDSDLAMKCFQKAVSIMPDYAEAHYAMAQLYRASGEEDAAIEAMKAYRAGRSPSISNDTIEFAFWGFASSDQEIVDVSLQHAKAGHPEKAIEVLQGAIRMRRDSIAIRQCLGAIYLESGDFVNAMNEFNVALRFAPESADLLTLLGICHLEAGQIQLAGPHIEKARSISPDDVKVLSAYGALCLARGDAENAEAAFRRALEQQPKDPALLFRASKASLALGDKSEARNRLNASVSIAPDYAPSRFSLGLLDMQEGNPKAAAAQWELIVNAGAAFPDAYLALAGMASQSSSFSDEIRFLEMGHANCTNSAALTNALAWALATTPRDDLRDTERALQLATKAGSMSDDVNHEFLDTLAVAQAATGAFDLAVETMKQAIRAAETGGATSERIAQYRERIAQFENKKPYVRSSN